MHVALHSRHVCVEAMADGCCADGHASINRDDASGCCGSGSVTWCSGGGEHCLRAMREDVIVVRWMMLWMMVGGTLKQVGHASIR